MPAPKDPLKYDLWYKKTIERLNKYRGNRKGSKWTEERKKKHSECMTGKKVHSEEWKKILSERWKGNTINVGIKTSKESNEKRRIAMTGKKFPGRKQSEEHNKKIGLSKLGKKRKPFSDEWKAKIGKSHLYISRGEKSANWKGGVTDLRKMIRDSYKYKEWRNNIYKRDKYTCQICKQKGGKLQGDHYPMTFKEIFHNNNIKNIEDAFFCEKFWDINNGRTLCENCHRKTPTWGYPKKIKT